MIDDKETISRVYDKWFKGTNLDIGDEMKYYYAKARHFEKAYEESGKIGERSKRKAHHSLRMAELLGYSLEFKDYCWGQSKDVDGMLLGH